MFPQILQCFLLKMVATSSLGLVLFGIFDVQRQGLAQVTPDTTLSTTIITSDHLNFVIENGDQSGRNLFHSFEEFSIPTNGSVLFNNAADIANIFSRVTGGKVSDIQGRLESNDTANLFLINPAGIVFGENASLNVGGSFFATTAESLIFGDGLEFSATRPSSRVPLLSVNVSPGLQMGQRSGSITINGPGHLIIGGDPLPPFDIGTASGLQVNSGQTLGLVAPDIHLIGGILKAPGGTIQISSASEGLLALNHSSNTWGLDHSAIQHFGDIRLSRQSLIESSGILGGDIHIQGRNIQIRDGSLVRVRSLGTQSGGDIHIDATESLQMVGFARIAPDQDTLLGTIPGVALPRIINETLGAASTGDIQITANRLQVEDGGSIGTQSYSNGSAGNVLIDVEETIEMGGTSPPALDLAGGIGSRIFGEGNAGNLLVTAQHLLIRNGMILASGTFGAGQGGDIEVGITGDLIIEGFKPSTASPSTLGSIALGTGNSGNVMVNVARLLVLNGGTLSTSTLGEGSAGTLTVNVSEEIRISGAIPDLALVSRINSDAPIVDEAFQQQFGTAERPSGNSGNVNVNTPRLIVTDGGIVSVSNQGFGNSGSLTINADDILLERQGRITALSTSGQGGDIELNMDNVLLLNHGSAITTDATGRLSDPTFDLPRQGENDPRIIPQQVNLEQANVDGGNLTVNAPFILGFNNSDITANAFEGNGGNITLSTQGLFGLELRDRPTAQSDITASSQFGLNGTVEINNPEADPNSQVLELPDTLVDASQLVQPGCSLNENQFVLTGRGGLPSSPLDLLSGDRLWLDTRDISNFMENEGENAFGTMEDNRISLSTPVVLAKEPSITEATLWHTNELGQIELFAAHNSQGVFNPHASCSTSMSGLVG